MSQSAFAAALFLQIAVVLTRRDRNAAALAGRLAPGGHL
jgi:hypothetical protein